MTRLIVIANTWIARAACAILSFAGPASARSTTSVCYFPAFSRENAGYQYRVRNWVEILRENGFTVKEAIVFEERELKWLDTNNWRLYIYPVWRRILEIWRSRKFETVIVRRELLIFNDYGNLFLEKLLLTFHPNAILDFDDDIAWAKQEQEPRRLTLFGKLIGEHRSKFSSSIRMYKNFIVGSEFLKEYVKAKAGSSQKNIVVIPTCVDYDKEEVKTYSTSDHLKLGWIGGVGNIHLLDIVVPALEKFNEEVPLELLVISGEDYKPDVSFPVINQQWSMETQVAQMKQMDIGLMPLYNTPGDQGKCGFKLIQYMGLGIPGISSGITVNKEIVDDGVNGWLVPPDGDWLPVLRKAVRSRDQFPEMGRAAREKILGHYTFKANAEKYLDFISSNAAS